MKIVARFESFKNKIKRNQIKNIQYILQIKIYIISTNPELSIMGHLSRSEIFSDLQNAAKFDACDEGRSDLLDQLARAITTCKKLNY